MVGRSNEISRENCRVQDADGEPTTSAARDTANSMAQASRWRIARRAGANTAMPATSEEAARQESELS